MDTMLIFWLIAGAVFLLLELVTAALCSIWFVIGAVISAAAAALGAPIWLQILLFLIVSGGCFALLYPRLKHLIRRRSQPTNADMLIGQTCIVTKTIDNIAGTGAVTVAGKTWTARAADGKVIPEGSRVRAEAIEGVKLMVSSLCDEAAVL